jgi:magnesium transporter
MNGEREPAELAKDVATLVLRLADERAADIVDVLNEQSPEAAAKILLAIPSERAVEVLDTPGLENMPEIVIAVPRERIMPLLSAMSADRLADLFRGLPEPGRSQFLDLLDADSRATLQQLLAYPQDSVGSIMTTEFVSVPTTWTVEQTLQHVRMVERTRETVYAILVLDPQSKALVKVVQLRRLISTDSTAAVSEAAAARRPITVSAHASRDNAARLISKYDLLAVAVVDDAGRPIGIVTVDDVIDFMVQRQTAEVQRFGGMEALEEPYMDIGFLKMIRKRAGWLCALFLSEMLTASAMQGFEAELQRAIVLTMFIPLIMSSGGNSGSQATSLLIRALALQQVRLGDWWRVAVRELPSGIVLGAILGLIGIVRITLWQSFGLYNYGEHWMLVALTVGVALMGIVTFGSLTGSMLPFILQKLGFDPATASAPFVATLVDVTGLVIYFTTALVILHGTLL